MDATPKITSFESLASPMYIMAKPASSTCNLNCRYCYYTEKESIYKSAQHREMSSETLATFIKKYIEAQSTREVLFTWHGGEPMIRPLSFYREAVRLQRFYARGHVIDNCIQTNGTLITEEWCRFLKDNNWLVGVSIDGPAWLHDSLRRTRNGKDTHRRVMEGIGLLDKHGVEWNAMAVVNSANACHPDEFYSFFKSIGCRYIQFAPIVERVKEHPDGRHLASALDAGDYPLTPESVTPAQWGDFLCRLFDLWVREDVGEYFIQIFDATLANWVGEVPGVCVYARSCGHAGVMEYNGDVYSCDHFVFPEYKLGNIRRDSFIDMMYGERQYAFGAAKLNSLPGQCRRCEYLFVCNGECPKNRFAATADGERGLNYLCEGYRRYYEHTTPYMRFMRDELLNGRAPANVMGHIQEIRNPNP